MKKQTKKGGRTRNWCHLKREEHLAKIGAKVRAKMRVRITRRNGLMSVTCYNHVCQSCTAATFPKTIL